MKKGFALVLAILLTTNAFADPAPQASSTRSTKKTAARKNNTTSATAAKLDKLEQALEAQQQQIQQLRQELQTRDQAMQQMQQRLDQSQTAATQAQSTASQAASQATEQQQAVSTLKTEVSDLKQNATSTALSLQETQKNVQSAIESPLALHYKGITITPGGFLAAETVYRTRALGSDINTPFNSVPMPGATQATMGEFFGSGRQSRVSMLAEGKLKSVKMTGYVEADFLSAGTTSNNNESNSYTLRQRQVWGQAALENGWSFTGGQMWSLVTETKKGVDNRTEALPMTIDPQYHVGFSWARQYGVRAAKNFGNKAWLAFSVENSQETLTAHGNGNNFVLGSAGTSGGLYNPAATYSFNPAPDFIAKAVFEPGIGHYEVFGLVSKFRERIFPCATTSDTGTCGGTTGSSAALAFNNSTWGGGIGANARVTVKKQFDFGVHFLGGNGIGRYGTAGLADVTVDPVGSLALIRSYQGLGTLELHKTKFDIYLNGGAEYAGRRSFVTSSGKGEGYGSELFKNTGCFTETPPGTPTSGQFPTSSNGFLPGSLSSCTADTRVVTESTAGFWYRLYKGPKGTLQLGPQYSYVTRNTWAGSGGAPHGIENMVLTSFRYYLP